jgi:hypothetical protein
MSVHNSGGPWPSVSNAAENNDRNARVSRISTRTSHGPSHARYSEEHGGRDEVMPEGEYTAQTSAASSNKDGKKKWYQYLGRGMYLDVRNRLPYYGSDWTDAWNYRVVPATLVSAATRSRYNSQSDSVLLSSFSFRSSSLRM